MFTRLHEAGKTKIRDHKFKNPKLCRKILGYDANALYLSTMLQEMPCGKEKIVRYEDVDNQETAAILLKQRLKKGTWFGFAEVDIEIPPHLRDKFEEMCPFFYNKKVPVESVPKHVLDYLAKTGKKRLDAKKLVRALSAKKLLLFAPLLQC